VNGDDIRRACGQGTDFHGRFVYNGSYNEQLRSYEVVADGVGGAYVVARAMGAKDISQTFLNFEFDLWDWEKSQAKLDSRAFETLKGRFQGSGVYSGAPQGLRLESDLYYWTAIVCRRGEVFFNAWQYPSDRFKQLTFPEALLELDDTGLAYRQPRQVDRMYREKYQRSARAGNMSGPYFELMVKGNRLADVGGVFR
jgi:hypothetical protein